MQEINDTLFMICDQLEGAEVSRSNEHKEYFWVKRDLFNYLLGIYKAADTQTIADFVEKLDKSNLIIKKIK